MTEHVPNDLLSDFVAGELADDVAVAVAEHLDRCAHCATRAAHLEPLAAAFASVDDPVVPAELAPAILRVVQAPPSTPRREVAVGVVLLVAAAGLAATSMDPSTVAQDAGGLLSAAQVVARNLVAAFQPQVATLAATAVSTAVAAAGAAWWLARPRTEVG